MPLNILNGTNVAFDITLQNYAAGLSGAVTGSATSMKCHFNSLDLTFRREVATEILTFCSIAYTDPVMGRITGDFSLSGYITSGSVYSDPLVLIQPANQPKMKMVATFDTGLTLTTDVGITMDALSARAFGEFGRQVQGRTKGTPVTVWVIT